MGPKQLVLPLAALLVLGGCSSAQRKPFNPTECNEASARDRGFVEGKQGMDPDSSYSYSCREDLRDKVRAGYQMGYDKGRAEFIESQKQIEGEMPTHTPIPDLYHCKIQFGGLGFESEADNLNASRSQVVEQCSKSFSTAICQPLAKCQKGSGVPGNPKAFYCSLEVFTRKYDSFGSTELETRTTLAKQCAEKEKSDFFCRDDRMACRRNY